MTSIRTLLSVELTKLLRRPMTWILSVILIGFTAFIYMSLVIALLAPESANIDKTSLEKEILLPDGLYFGASLAGSFVTILIIILAAGSIGSEFSWATVRTNLLMGATRTRFLAAKFLALVIITFGWLLIANVMALAGEVITAAATDHAIPTGYLTSATFAADSGLILFHSIVVLAVWTLIATAITVITGSLAAGLGVTLSMTLLGSSIAGLIAQIGDIGRWVARIIPNRALDAILSLDATDPTSYLATDWIWIIASVVGWSLVIAFLAVRRFQRMNLVGGS